MEISRKIPVCFIASPKRPLLFQNCYLISCLPAREADVEELGDQICVSEALEGREGSSVHRRARPASVSAISSIGKVINMILFRHRLCCKSEKKLHHRFGLVLTWQVCDDHQFWRWKKCTFHFSDMMSISFSSCFERLPGSSLEKDK